MKDFEPPLVTLGLPLYNGEAFLEDALVSLLEQNYPNLEILIADNCSTDRSREICVDFSVRDTRIRLHQNEFNVGAAANFNKVVELARGEYFAWVNHDDLWEYNYVSRALAVMQSDPSVVLAYARSAKINSEGEIVSSLIDQLALDDPAADIRLARYHDLFRMVDKSKGGWNTHGIEGLWTPVYGLLRTQVLRETGMIGPYIASDTILLEELLMRGKFYEIPDRLFFKRDHDERSMRAKMTYDDRIDWFTGCKAGKLIFPRWRLLVERLRAVRRANVPPGMRFRCYREMLGFYIRRPHEGKVLVKEILINLMRLVEPVLRFAGLRRMHAPSKW